MAAVSCSHLKKVYKGNVTAIEDLSLDIRDGEFLALCGPSGCGKSTLIRMIAGLEEVTEGDIYFNDLFVNDLLPKDRDLAMVSQEYALYPHMTVYRNLSWGLEMKKLPPDEIDVMVHKAARLLELDSLLDRKPKTLSGGQLQRVALGRAIVRNPEVFLLDEPLSNLDVSLRNKMRLQIMRLHEKLDSTFIYVTHDQMEAMTMADRIAVMKDGLIQQVDTPKNIYQHPATLFTARFIGFPAIGTAESVLLREGENYCLNCNGFRVKVPVSEDDRDTFDKLIGHKVIFGIRPEYIRAEVDDSPKSAAFTEEADSCVRINAEILDSRMIGSDLYLTIDVNGGELTVRCDSSCPLQPKEAADFLISSNHLLVFDPETERSLLTWKE